MKYRGKQEIIQAVLNTINAEGGASKTNVMYKAFLSYAQVNEYLDYCTTKQLIKKDAENHYSILQKGRDCLQLIKKLMDLLT